MLDGYKVPITHGRVFRDINSRIIANFKVSMQHPDLDAFLSEKGVMDVDYVCLDNSISADKDQPSAFDVAGETSTEAGESIYDVISHTKSINNIPTTITYTGSAAGILTEERFEGHFTTDFDIVLNLRILGIQNLKIIYKTSGSFWVEIED